MIILTGEGPLAFCSGGDQRVRGDTGYVPEGAGGRALPRHRPARADAPPAQAGRRDGGRLRDRRRAHPAPRLRPHDRRRQRALRADRPARGLVRRRLRRLAAGQHGRPEEGEGDLVPVPPVRRAAGARHGAGQHGRAARRARGGDGRAGAARCSRSPPSRCGCSRRASTPPRTGCAGIQQLAHDANLLFYATEEAAEGREAFKAKRTPDFSQFPSGRERRTAAERPSSVRIWLMAARPRTLPAAVAPVLVGTALAATRGHVQAARPSSPRCSARCSSRSARTSPTTTPTRGAAPTPRTGSARCA